MDAKTKVGRRGAGCSDDTKPAPGRAPVGAEPSLAIQSEPTGRRERNKANKLRRISAAARQQFANKGYDGTTLRDIAQEADVALGTIGFYAENKQDLVLLIFNEAVSDLVLRLSKSAQYDGSLVDSLISFLRPMYEAFAAEVPLYRILLRENVFHATSKHAIEFKRHRGVLMAGLSDLVRRAAVAGEVRSSLDVELAGRTSFFVFFAAVRWWIAMPTPKVEQGIADLRDMFAMLVDGFKATPSPRRQTRTARAPKLLDKD